MISCLEVRSGLRKITLNNSTLKYLIVRLELSLIFTFAYLWEVTWMILFGINLLIDSILNLLDGRELF